MNIGNWKIEEEALTTDENDASEDVLYNMMCDDDDRLEDNPTSDENDANADDQHRENPITDEKVFVAEVSKMMCDQPGVIPCKVGVTGLDLVVTGRGNMNTEVSHNQCDIRVGVDLAETGCENFYNESSQNQGVPGTGFGNKTGLEEECHTQNMPTKKKMENPQQRKKVWKKNKNGLFG